MKRPETDQVIANALVSSGYLDLWKKEVDRHPWRYTSGLMDKLSEPPKLLCDYCIGTIKEAYSGGVRFAINLIQLKALQEKHPRRAFCLEIDLYETLVSNPRACAHRFHEHVATDSTMMWPPIPRHVATLLR